MKKLLTVLFALLIVFTAAGCSGSGNGTPSEDDKTQKFTVGVVQLVQHPALDAATQGFEDVLKAEFGDNVDIDIKNASGDIPSCATIVSGFVNNGVDLIMANATPALQAASSATGDIPILGTSVTEYGVALGIENFNGVVGSNVSGTSDLAPLDQQAQMFLDLLPEAKSVGIIYCSNEANSIYQVQVVKQYDRRSVFSGSGEDAAKLGKELVLRTVAPEGITGPSAFLHQRRCHHRLSHTRRTVDQQTVGDVGMYCTVGFRIGDHVADRAKLALDILIAYDIFKSGHVFSFHLCRCLQNLLSTPFRQNDKAEKREKSTISL